MKRALARVAAGTSAALALCSLAALSGPRHWLADLFTHFVPHYLAAALLALGALLWARRWVLAGVAALAAGWNGFLLAAALSPGAAPAIDGGTPLQILQFNVGRDNAVPLATIGYLQSLSRPPDVIVLLETTPRWAPLIRLLAPAYPTIAQMPRRDNFGMAILSRLPESEVEFRETGTPPLPMLVLRGRAGDEAFRLYAVHPPPPLGARLSRARDAQLQILGEELGQAGDGAHVIVAGDFNATPWSSALAPLRRSGLRDAQRGRGYLPTWAPPPLARLAGIPIDLAMVSENVWVTARRAGPWLGSDHWPVHTRVLLH